MGKPLSGQSSVQIRMNEMVCMVDASFIYPREEPIKEFEIKEAGKENVLEYSCDDTHGCKFDVVIDAIKKSAELKSLGMKCPTTEIVASISQNPEIFLRVMLEDMSCKIINPRYGFADLTEIKSNQIFEAMREQNDGIKVAGMTALIGVAVGVYSFNLFGKMRKHF